MTIVQGITLGIAILGAILGIINTWHAIDTRRIKLKVVPALAEFQPSGEKSICVEVINLGAFPITVSDVGFLRRGTRARLAIIRPIILDEGSFPRRLEAHSAFTVHTTGVIDDPFTLRTIKCAYAKTQCGFVQKGTSGMLKSLVMTAKEFKAPTTA
jgi:hypothetical protein